MFAFLASHQAQLFPDADDADLFAPPGSGRPSIPATQMAAVMVLQALHDYSDWETAEAPRFDARWKAAIGASRSARSSPAAQPAARPGIPLCGASSPEHAGGHAHGRYVAG